MHSVLINLIFKHWLQETIKKIFVQEELNRMLLVSNWVEYKGHSYFRNKTVLVLRDALFCGLIKQILIVQEGGQEVLYFLMKSHHLVKRAGYHELCSESCCVNRIVCYCVDQIADVYPNCLYKLEGKDVVVFHHYVPGDKVDVTGEVRFPH